LACRRCRSNGRPATAFVKFMADPANAALIRKEDMEPPER
jgi:hypothetical protein